MTYPLVLSFDPAAALQRVQAAATVVIDTETTGVDHRCNRLVGIAVHIPGDSMGFYLPVYSEIDPPKALTPEVEALAVAAAALESPAKLVVFHNAAFDLAVFRKSGLRARCRLFDTMLAMHRLDNTLRTVCCRGRGLNYKLKTLSWWLLGAQQQTFEAATKGRPAQMTPISRMAPYAVGDAYYTGELFAALQVRLGQSPAVEEILRDIDFPLLPVIVEMLHHGLRVDPAFAEACLNDARQKFESQTKAIAALSGQNLDVGKRSNLRRVLAACGVAEAEYRRSLSENSLSDMRKDAPEKGRRCIDMVLARREQAHLIHGIYTPLLGRVNRRTNTLRAASCQSLTDSCRFSMRRPNLLGLPKDGDVRKLIVAGPGEKIVSIDFRRIEPRCLAQALLLFVSDGGQAVMQARSENLHRAKSCFNDLLKVREFTQRFVNPPPLPYPAASALARCFVGGTDPYEFTAQQVFGATDPASCRKAKTVFLATIYGQGRYGLAAKLNCSLDDATRCLNKLAVALPELGVSTYQRVQGHWVRREPTTATYKAEVEQLIRLTGEVRSLFGRRRCFAGLKALRESKRATILYQFEGRFYDVELAPVQLWNYALHAYVYCVRNHDNGAVLATSEAASAPVRFTRKPGLCKWPFRQLSYKCIRSVTTDDGRIVKFEPLQDIYREGFNSVIQMTAGDIFKKAILAVVPIMQQHGARLLLPVHDELVVAVPVASLGAFVAGARTAMTRPPASWWEVPIEVKVEVGDNYGAMQVYP